MLSLHDLLAASRLPCAQPRLHPASLVVHGASCGPRRSNPWSPLPPPPLVPGRSWYQTNVVRPLARTRPERCSRAYGFLCVISFPHYYAASFGRLGGADERRWSEALASAGVPAKCCCMHHLVYNAAYL